MNRDQMDVDYALDMAETLDEAPNAEALADTLQQVLESLGFRADSYATAGVMTSNAGLVLRTSAGEFQLTVVQSR